MHLEAPHGSAAAAEGASPIKSIRLERSGGKGKRLGGLRPASALSAAAEKVSEGSTAAEAASASRERNRKP